MNVAIIPARGGSKRIPDKNVKSFCGKPILAYSIETALQLNLFDAVIVSTDSDQIAEVAEQYGASAPYRRPAELSDDFTPTIPVIRHAIDQLEADGNTVDLACCIYPTAPLLQPEYLREGFEKLSTAPDADFAFSVTDFEFPIFRAVEIVNDRVQMFWPEHELTRSQDLPTAYHDAGQFYWGRADSFRNNDRFFSANSIPIVLPRKFVQDIDTPEDWEIAEQLYRAFCS